MHKQRQHYQGYGRGQAHKRYVVLQDLTRLLVVARFRPTNKIESQNAGQTVVEFESEDTCSVKVGQNPYREVTKSAH